MALRALLATVALTAFLPAVLAASAFFLITSSMAYLNQLMRTCLQLTIGWVVAQVWLPRVWALPWAATNPPPCLSWLSFSSFSSRPPRLCFRSQRWAIWAGPTTTPSPAVSLSFSSSWLSTQFTWAARLAPIVIVWVPRRLLLPPFLPTSLPRSTSRQLGKGSWRCPDGTFSARASQLWSRLWRSWC